MSNLRKAFAETMVEVASIDKKIVIIVGDISHGLFEEFRNKFPSRYFNIGILESGMVSVASGISKTGLIPIVHTIAPFLIERSFEQIKLGFGYQELSGNFVSVGSSFDYSKLGCSHHSYYDVSLMAHIPNSQVFLPSSYIEFKKLFKLTYNSGHLNYFRLTENPHNIDLSDSDIAVGKSIKIKEGKDATIFALGPQLSRAVTAANLLIKEGIEAEIIYFHTFKPFDEHAVIESIKKTRVFITLDELSKEHNLFQLIQRSIAGNIIAFGEQVTVTDFVRLYGKYDQILDEIGFRPEQIDQKIKGLISKKNQLNEK